MRDDGRFTSTIVVSTADAVAGVIHSLEYMLSVAEIYSLFEKQPLCRPGSMVEIEHPTMEHQLLMMNRVTISQ